jgi:hypothetical protein
MRCEPWMNYTPTPKLTPLQQAQKDMRHWKHQLEEAEKRVAECRDEFAAAVNRVASFPASAR